MANTLNEYSKKNDLKKRIIFICGIILLVFALAISSILIFQHTYYTPFWVNGQSMYPTLNKDAKYKESGELIGERSHSGANMVDLDYGFMSTSTNSINHIKRFDIVILKYNQHQESNNIKRIIALPGETFYFTSSSDESNGQLHVYNNQLKDYEIIEQPIDNYHLINGNYINKYVSPTTLKDDEYFVLGDNRIGSNSYDSRSVGPIKKELINGVAIGLNGKANVDYINGEYSISSINHYFPRFF